MNHFTFHRLLSIILLSGISLYAAPIEYKSPISSTKDSIDANIEIKSVTAIANTLVVASTDLTNLNKSKFSVYYDISNPSIKAGVNSLSDRNLCDIEKFKKSAGTFTCSRDISYTIIYDPKMADIYVTDNPQLYIYGKKLFVYIGERISADSIPLQFIIDDKKLKMEIDTKKLKEQGFVPDPLLKIEK